MSLFAGKIEDLVQRASLLFEELEELSLEDKIEAINRIKLSLKEHSPFKKEPVDCVLWVPAEKVYANKWNPNTVAPPEMKLLARSIKKYGYTMPIVTCPISSEPDIEEYFKGYDKPEISNDEPVDGVVDGFHRNRVGKENKAVKKRVLGYLPVSRLNEEHRNIKDLMAATIEHNRARGKHGIDGMVNIVAVLIKEGWTDAQIVEELGMDVDEVLRFKQQKGLPELFKNHEFSPSWESDKT